MRRCVVQERFEDAVAVAAIVNFCSGHEEI
jgi:hypothetical protein